MRQKLWWIKERDNPQLGVYWVACGQLSHKEARAMEKTAYGSNFMYSFETQEAYEDRLRELRNQGEKVQ